MKLKLNALATIIALLTSQLVFSQKDNSLTYLDLIAKNNLNIVENQAQYIVNWDEMPPNIKGVRKIVETHYIAQIDESDIPDTIFLIGENKEQAIKGYSRNIDFIILKNDSVEIVEDSLLSQIYKNSQLLSIHEENKRMDFKYYDSGLLKEIIYDDKTMISSVSNEDTINYIVNLRELIPVEIIKPENIPTIEIKLIIDRNAECYCYQNYFHLKKLTENPVLNKEITQCKNGNVTKEMVLDRYSNYQEVEKITFTTMKL